MAKILMVGPEATPFAKTGGLADVLGALPKALRELGEDVALVIPRYGCVALDGLQRVYNDMRIWLGATSYPTDLYSTIERGVPVFLVDCPALYDRQGLYGLNGQDHPDNHVRFAVFSKAALEVARRIFRPHIIHCHDWQTALAPVYLKTFYASDPTFYSMRTLFTVHNLGYQGLFPRKVLSEVGLDPSLFHPDGLEFYGQVNFLKGGLVFSDALSTVSKGYAREIQTPEYGFALDGLLRARSAVLTGILNGVDYEEWNPETDPFIAQQYSAENLEGKRVCKRDLIEEFGLPVENLDTPLIGIVSRFDVQKGFDLLAEAAPQLAREDMRMAVLGTGHPDYERMFLELAQAHPEKFGVRVAYDNRLAHKIEAGADIFLMPSRYEPCGLNQIYSLRYGTVPVVRATGGLDDTIDETTGFKFSEYTSQALMGALREALAAYSNREKWTQMVRAGMSKDFSWRASAAEYAALYRRLNPLA